MRNLNYLLKLMDKKFPLCTKQYKVKYLGMYLDECLSWEIHIYQLSVKLSCANGILAKLRHYIPKST